MVVSQNAGDLNVDPQMLYSLLGPQNGTPDFRKPPNLFYEPSEDDGCFKLGNLGACGDCKGCWR